MSSDPDKMPPTFLISVLVGVAACAVCLLVGAWLSTWHDGPKVTLKGTSTEVMILSIDAAKEPFVYLVKFPDGHQERVLKSQLVFP